MKNTYSRLEFAGVLTAVFAVPLLAQEDVDDVTNGLLAQANSVLESKGYSLTSRCRNWLREYVREGVARMFKEKEQAKLPEARANIRRFANKMIEERMPSLGKVIDDEAFAKTKSALCPLYPFC